MEYINALDEKAYKLYKKRASTDDFIKAFSRDDLIKLWYQKCTYKFNKDGALIDGEAYDDEIYDALDSLNFFD